MKLENGKISNLQFAILILSFMQSMPLTVNFSFEFTRQDTWLTVLVASALAFLAALMYLAIAKGHPGKNLVQINDAVFGAVLGKLVSACYLWFFLQLVVHNFYYFNSFWLTFIMPETPRSAFLILLGMICVLAVRKGLETISRCSLVFWIIAVFTTVTISVFVSNKMDLRNLLPVLHTPPRDFVQSVHIMLVIPFCEIVVFLMIFPYVEDQKRLTKPMLISVGIASVHLLIVTLRNIIVLGPILGLANSDSFLVSRQVDIGNVITRMDILIAITMLITIFFKTAVILYATSLGTAQALKLRDYRTLAIPLTALAVALAAELYPSDMEQGYAAGYVWPFNATVFELLLPLLTLAVIKIRALLQKLKLKRAGDSP